MTINHSLILLALLAGIIIGFAGGYGRRRILVNQLENLQVLYEREVRENNIWRDMHPETEPEVREMMTLPVYDARPRYPDARDHLNGGMS